MKWPSTILQYEFSGDGTEVCSTHSASLPQLFVVATDQPTITQEGGLATMQNRRVIHPVHALLLAASLPLFLGALLSDWAYSSTYQIQWINFAAWLGAGALVFAGLALAWALIDLSRADVPRDRGSWLYVLVLLATVVLSFVNALVHGKDAGATMPAGLTLSVLVLLLALVATWLGFATLRSGAVR